jgi:hypothetical protein
VLRVWRGDFTRQLGSENTGTGLCADSMRWRRRLGHLVSVYDPQAAARAMHHAVRREPLRFECACGGRWLTEADLELHLRFARKDAFRRPGVPHAGPECEAESRAHPEGITEQPVYEVERDRHGLMYSGPLEVGECLRVQVVGDGGVFTRPADAAEGITEEQVARALNAWWASQQIGEDETRSMREALGATLQQGEDVPQVRGCPATFEGLPCVRSGDHDRHRSASGYEWAATRYWVRSGVITDKALRDALASRLRNVSARSESLLVESAIAGCWDAGLFTTQPGDDR